MNKGYHPYIESVPSTPSKKAMELELEEYDSSDDEAVNTVYLGSKKRDWEKLYLEEKRKRKILAKFIRDLLA